MHKYTYQSATARCQALGRSGVVEVFLTGLVDARAFFALREQAQADALVRQAEVLLVRYDKAVVTMLPAEMADARRYPEGGPSLIYITDASYHETARHHCAWLSNIGVICAVFRDTPEQVRLGYLTAHRQAQLRLQRSPRNGDRETAASPGCSLGSA